MTRRCADWDYRQRSIYQITLVQADRRKPLLGRLEVKLGDRWVSAEAARTAGLQPEEVEARVVFSELGEAILAHWKRIGEFTPEIRPLFCVIMPDHLHAILEVTHPMAKPLGNAIGGFKTGCEKIYQRLAPLAQDKRLAPLAQDKRLAPLVQGERLAPLVQGERLGAVEPNCCGSAACPVSAAPAAELPRLWAPGFQDTILFRAGQLDNMFNYLRDNPRRLAVKRLFPELFRVVRRLRVGGVGCFSALGNRFLLDRPLRQVQVSRSDFGYKREPKPGGGLKISREASGAPITAFSTAAFAEKREAMFDAARRGEVLVSPCVSDGEREIARLALEAKLPLVSLKNKGFSPLQKPAGRAFDACSDGRLLMLAPIAWPYVPGERAMCREDALVMNRLAQLLAGDGAAEINYHGAKLANVDALAAAAVGGFGEPAAAKGAR